MALALEELRNALSSNRAEELGRDVWKKFVVPPYLDQLDLQTARKPRILIGGRGCGKTMLFRYLSHSTTFSPSRSEIPSTAISHVGLYWRTDTQFCNAMTARGVSEDVWSSAFGHYVALTVAIEFIDALNSVAASSAALVTATILNELDLTELQAFDSSLPSGIVDLRKDLLKRLWSFETWVNNVRKVSEPLFLPGMHFALALIRLAKESVVGFKELSCYVYIDEYENLCDYQRKVINTYLKHCEAPLVFHVAMKRHAFHDRGTLGAEAISDIHDFRQYDLESYLVEDGFSTFAAEILLLTLAESGIAVPIDAAILRDPSATEVRKSPEYTQRVKSYASTLFPDVSQDDLARFAFREPSVMSLLEERIARALHQRGRRFEVRRFIRSNSKAASIISPALLSRRAIEPETVLEELDKLANGQSNRFTGRSDWIHNNFVGCLLQLYAPFRRPCPLYAGFNTFCHLSRGNLRHFLELCYKSLSRAVDDPATTHLQVNPLIQAEAARLAATGFLGEVRSFGARGEQLHAFVLRLGALFAIAHARPTQSEPEQNHFSITRGAEDLSSDDMEFLREATKWSVLFEEPGTKVKDPGRPDPIDYVLNPIYSPYFYISYRKKRKLELSTSHVIRLMRGTVDDFSTMTREFAKRWDVVDSGAAPAAMSLFSE